MANDSAPSQATKRPRNVEYTYRNRDGTITKSFTDQVSHIIFKAAGGDETLEADLSLLFGGELPPPDSGATMAVMAAGFGIKTTCGNAVTGVKDEDKDDPSKVLEAIASRWQTICDGEWREGREGGPTLKATHAALIAYLERTKGKRMSDSKKAEALELIKAKGTKAYLDDPHIRAEYDALAAEAAAAKAAASRAKSANQKPAISGDLASLLD